jgi:hypothetical protein
MHSIRFDSLGFIGYPHGAIECRSGFRLHEHTWFPAGTGPNDGVPPIPPSPAYCLLHHARLACRRRHAPHDRPGFDPADRRCGRTRNHRPVRSATVFPLAVFRLAIPPKNGARGVEPPDQPGVGSRTGAFAGAHGAIGRTHLPLRPTSDDCPLALLNGSHARLIPDERMYTPAPRRILAVDPRTRPGTPSKRRPSKPRPVVVRSSSRGLPS